MKPGKYVHPVHGVWPLIGLLGVVCAKFYFANMPRAFLICPSRFLFGIRCPGCGSGGALLALTEFRFLDAIIANPLFVIGGLALCLWGAVAALGYSIGKPLPIWATTEKKKAILRYSIIAALLLTWIYELYIYPIVT